MRGQGTGDGVFTGGHSRKMDEVLARTFFSRSSEPRSDRETSIYLSP